MSRYFQESYIHRIKLIPTLTALKHIAIVSRTNDNVRKNNPSCTGKQTLAV